MNTQEWALITFTILAQMSVGAFVVLGAVYTYVKGKAGTQEACRMSDRALLAIGPVLALGLLASLLHLGNPLNAPRAVLNIGTSWLSREILFGIIFAVLGGAFALLQWRKLATPAIRQVLAYITALVGLVLVYAMAQVYMLETQPAWNTWATPVLFFATTILLGSLAVGAAYIANYAYLQKAAPEAAPQQLLLLKGAMRGIAIAAVAVLGVQLVVIPIQLAQLAANPQPAASASLQILYGEFGLLFALRLALVFIGAGVFGLFLYRSAASAGGREQTIASLVYAAFALVFIAEVIGRFLFYATHYRIGI
jgi:anaerobic dimethyl sulfoxide reductase subunit C